MSMQGETVKSEPRETWTPESGRVLATDWKGDSLVRTGALLGAGTAIWLATRSSRPLAIAGAALAVIPLALRTVTGRWPFTESMDGRAAIPIRASVTVARTSDEVFDAWRSFDRLPEVLKYVLRVSEIGPGRTEWLVRTPAGGELCLRSVLVREHRPQTLTWHSLPDSDVEQRGSIDFRTARDGNRTHVRVRLEVVPPPVARAAGKVFRSVLAAQIREDLRRFRDSLESGRVTPTTRFGEGLSATSSRSSF
jgi:uncharacterized membrane protein